MQDATAPDTSPPSPGENWRTSYPSETYATYCGLLNHYSLKANNSNAPAGGVRLAGGDALDLPYVSARTLIACGRDIPRDYTGNANPYARIASQIDAFEKGTARPPTEAEEHHIRTIMETARTVRHAFGLSSVPVRLRQLLIEQPDAEERYVAVTPLNSPGLSQVINDEVARHNQILAKKDQRQIRSAELLWGGSNPQNIGGLIRAMQHALVFFAPRSRASLRRALFFYYRGISLRPSRAALKRYRDWKRVDAKQHGDVMRATMHRRENEQRHIAGMVAEITSRGRTAYDMLQKHQASLPGNGTTFFSDDVPQAVRALIDPSTRDHTWPRESARAIARTIIDHSGHDDDGPLSLRERSGDSLIDLVEESL